jgi:hypothetical protein
MLATRYPERLRNMPDDVPHGGAGRRAPNLETRVALLEAALDEIRTELKAIRAEVASLRLDMAEMKGRLATVPSTFQLIYIQIAFILATFAGAVGILRFAPH